MFTRLGSVLSGSETVPEEVVARLKRSLFANGSRVMDVFRAWDADTDGTINFDEFAKAVRELGLDGSDAEVMALFRVFDADDSGTIVFAELNKFLRRGTVSAHKLEVPREMLEARAQLNKFPLRRKEGGPTCATSLDLPLGGVSARSSERSARSRAHKASGTRTPTPRSARSPRSRSTPAMRREMLGAQTERLRQRSFALPGPGAYDPSVPTGRGAFPWAASKTARLPEDRAARDIGDPGQYNPHKPASPDLAKRASVRTSPSRRTQKGKSNFGTSSERISNLGREQKLGGDSPGPGAYPVSEFGQAISGRGGIIFSSSPKIKDPVTQDQRSTPSPGHYEVPRPTWGGSVQSTRPTPFGSGQRRFPSEQTPTAEHVGPGSYQPEAGRSHLEARARAFGVGGAANYPFNASDMRECLIRHGAKKRTYLEDGGQGVALGDRRNSI